MKIGQTQTFRAQNQTLIPSTRKRAIIQTVTNPTRVDICFIDNPQTVIKNVPTSLQIQFSVSSGALLANQRCVVDIFGEANSKDFVVAYTY